MKKLSICGQQQGAAGSLFAALLWLLASCESTRNQPPPVTAEFAKVGARQHVDLAMLGEGRVLFVSRCIECHTLPAVGKHTAAEWPALIDEMAGRANLKPEQRGAVLAYILAAREL
jgi:mono/diheme cytochrome c family protein